MRFLICGLGSIGRRHLRNLIALGEEDIVLFRTGRSTLPNDDLPPFPVEHDLEVALQKWSPDATIVANPTSVHMKVALAAANAGSHLFIEKPISDTMDQLDDLRLVTTEKKLQVFVGFQFRFHPGLQHVKRLVNEKTIGEVLLAQVEWGEYLPGWHPWEDYRKSYSARKDLGGGVVLTLCHPFDYLRWLLGEVRGVTAEIGRSGELEIDVEDTADVALRFERGFLGTVHLDYLQRPEIHRLKIVGSESSLLWDNADGSVRWWSTDSNERSTLTVPKGFDRNQLFLDEMKHFIEIVSDEGVPRCSLEDGIRALEIALAVHESAIKGRRVELQTS